MSRVKQTYRCPTCERQQAHVYPSAAMAPMKVPCDCGRHAIRYGQAMAMKRLIQESKPVSMKDMLEE